MLPCSKAKGKITFSLFECYQPLAARRPGKCGPRRSHADWNNPEFSQREYMRRSRWKKYGEKHSPLVIDPHIRITLPQFIECLIAKNHLQEEQRRKTTLRSPLIQGYRPVLYRVELSSLK